MTKPTYTIETTNNFKNELKALIKKYKSIVSDVENLRNELENDPMVGASLGKGFYKIRMAITSKGQGKSGGARVIVNVRIINKVVGLISIYDKSEKKSIPMSELKAILKTIN